MVRRASEALTFRDRPLDVFLDATYCKDRVGRRVVSQTDGRREVLGFEVGETELQPF